MVSIVTLRIGRMPGLKGSFRITRTLGRNNMYNYICIIYIYIYIYIHIHIHIYIYIYMYIEVAQGLSHQDSLDLLHAETTSVEKIQGLHPVLPNSCEGKWG